MTGDDDLITLADRLLRGEVQVAQGSSARTTVFLLRLALERELDAYWDRIGLPVLSRNPMRAQLLCLTEYADLATATSARSLWGQLSQACHYHSYELSPASHELRRWHTELNHLVARLRRRQGPDRG
ncbi:hypothetical protein J4573_29160 [Actinomadura barringtoniae]|uniref:Uncharacterized protein n=1 Tax=Actinomadura barringtoniae TaxID=1427535 RepID=A0A939T6S4_9ACTN|nr:hypothetical protein [Actinomadura barringtoniae]MBO2451194.1 hypothetical protein [Actinomadura barringtoniae]